MADLWDRVGTTDDPVNAPAIPVERWDATIILWISGNAAGGYTNAEALSALRVETSPGVFHELSAAEQTEATRLKTAMNALPNDNARRIAHLHIRALANMRELGDASYPTGDSVQTSIIAYFSEQGVTY